MKNWNQKHFHSEWFLSKKAFFTSILHCALWIYRRWYTPNRTLTLLCDWKSKVDSDTSRKCLLFKLVILIEMRNIAWKFDVSENKTWEDGKETLLDLIKISMQAFLTSKNYNTFLPPSS